MTDTGWTIEKGHKEPVAFVIGGINNQITDEFGADNDLEVTGGGRGWTATTTIDGEVYTAKGTSKVGAAEALYEAIKAANPVVTAESDDEAGEEFEKCRLECQMSERDECQCSCEGANHGAGLGVGRRVHAVPVTNKFCQCGCGEITKRRFVPGHDARYHFAQKAAALGLTADELRKANKAASNKAASEKRRAQRAAVKATEAAAAAVAANVQ